MISDYQIVDVTESNISSHPEAICFINPKHKYFHLKVDWLMERFKEGLTIKLLYLKGEKRAVGFIEYIPGEFAWRAVDAKGYLFIHCIWVTPNKNKNNGIGSLLINECLEQAARDDFSGVAVLTSSGAFMAQKDLFLKNGFVIAESSDPYFDLLYKPIKESKLPRINSWQVQPDFNNGLSMVYSKQCPWVARFIEEIVESAKLKGVDFTIKEISTAVQAQHAPSPYATFTLMNKGRILADHYISETRFLNILKKEKLI